MVELDLNEWLRPEDFSEGQKVIFLDEGEIKGQQETGFSKDVFDITVSLESGVEKVWTMNKTTQRNLAEVYGKDTNKWVGKRAVLQKARQMVNGKQKEVIYGMPEEEMVIKK